jgi:hypothetical protein
VVAERELGATLGRIEAKVDAQSERLETVESDLAAIKQIAAHSKGALFGVLLAVVLSLYGLKELVTGLLRP